MMNIAKVLTFFILLVSLIMCAWGAFTIAETLKNNYVSLVYMSGIFMVAAGTISVICSSILITRASQMIID